MSVRSFRLCDLTAGINTLLDLPTVDFIWFGLFESVNIMGKSSTSAKEQTNVRTKSSVTTSPQRVNALLTASTGRNIDWQAKKGTFYPFPVGDSDDSDDLDVLEFSVIGVVREIFLYEGALSHTISIEVEDDDVTAIKGMVEKIPGFNENGYRWPVNGNVLKFSAKGSDTTRPFAALWNADIGDVGNVDRRRPIEHSEIERGSKVLVEYTPVSYPGRRAKEEDPGFDPGCTLQLLSVGLLGAKRQRLNFESPRKKRRIGN